MDADWSRRLRATCEARFFELEALIEHDDFVGISDAEARTRAARSQPRVRARVERQLDRLFPVERDPIAVGDHDTVDVGPAARDLQPPSSFLSEAMHDPITLAVKTAGQVAETGLKVASRMAGEVLRRLPRP